ncbi:hypothetical protein VNI00_017670 [Paramarasmius palmivorus]|uniref:Nephrocystin 3-like N-terminal domain-containing protein n=1 Tax=Paramarasmius palmivorus TaxID=297713 RepID=A0AAW0B555_9AGAR
MSFNNPRDFTNHGGAYNYAYGPQTIQNINYGTDPDDILQVLASYTAVNATADAEARCPPPSCHPETRVKTLRSLDAWITERRNPLRVCWLNGSVGVGKSAIAQTISERYRSQVIGTFFFSRNDNTRDKLDPLIATIAYQCCTADPLRSTVGPLIIKAIRADPQVFHSSYENQLVKLILEPFANVRHAQQNQLSNLIVIDGLDECVDLASQQRLLGFIELAIAFRTCVPLIFLLCSRPEPQIRYGIESARFISCLKRINISGDSYWDIQRYFVDKFGELRRKYQHVLRGEGETWPGTTVIWDLTRRACGQFIFAVTVIKYIDNLDELPQDRLQTILNVEPDDVTESPYSALDNLYRQILSTCTKWEKIYPILRLLITPLPKQFELQTLWRSIVAITGLLNFRSGEVRTLLSRLHSVISISENDEYDIYIRHASFTQFLQHKARSREFHVQVFSEEDYYNLVIIFLLRTLSPLTPFYPPYCSSNQLFGTAYSIWKHRVGEIFGLAIESLNVARYCARVSSPSSDLLAELEAFDPYVLASLRVSCFQGAVEWVEWLSWAKSLSEDKRPERFIARVESFLQGVYVGF